MIGDQVKLVGVVRQRVGLLQPSRRPHRVRRRASLNSADVDADDDPAHDRVPRRLAGKRVIVRCDLNVPLKDGGSPTTAACARRCPPLEAARRPGRPRRRRSPTSGAPTARPTRSTASRPVAARLGELLGRAGRLRADTVGAGATADGRALADGERRRCSRTSGSTPGETSKVDAERAAFAAQLAALGDVVRLRRLRRRAPQAGERLRAGAAAAERGRPADRGRARRARPAHRDAGEAVHGRARRLEGLRQARRHRSPAAAGRLAAHRRRHALHLPRGPGPQGRREPARGRPARHGPRLPRRGRALGVDIVLPTDVVVASKFGADAEHVRHAGRRDRADAVRRIRSRPRHRPRDRRARSREVDPRIEDRVLERPDGRVRARAVRGRHRRRSRRRSPRSTASASSAAATRPRPSASSASPTTSSATSRPAAARASSSSKARNFPDWRSSDGSRTAPRSSRATGR